MGINFNGDISKILGQQKDAHVKPAGRFEADNIDIGGLLNGFKKEGGDSRPLDSKDLSKLIGEMNKKSREEVDKNGDGFTSSDEISEYLQDNEIKQMAKYVKEALAKAPEGLTNREKLAWLIENSDTSKPKPFEQVEPKPIGIATPDDAVGKPKPYTPDDWSLPKLK